MKIKGLHIVRAMVITGIVVYHLFFQKLSIGGFTSLNLFYLLSGFLLSFNLLKEIKHENDINIKNFLHKRFINLFPGFFLMLIVSLFLLFL